MCQNDTFNMLKPGKWYSTKVLAKRAGTTSGTINRHLQVLLRFGYVKMKYLPMNGRTHKTALWSRK